MRIDVDDCCDPDLLAAEVRRLRAVIAAGSPTLTDAEREALEWAGGNDWWTNRNTPTGERHAATLRGLLERLGGKR